MIVHVITFFMRVLKTNMSLFYVNIFPRSKRKRNPDRLISNVSNMILVFDLVFI